MISYMTGILADAEPEKAILEINGIGWEIVIHARAFSRLPRLGERITLHTHMQVLENEFKLYGFLTVDELRLFKLLLTVSGIGARGAANLLAHIEPADFYLAVASQDEKTLVKLPGIGKKTAQRLLFELKDKVQDLDTTGQVSAENSAMDDVIDALEALGYSRSEVFPLLRELVESGKYSNRVEENVKLVLKMKNSSQLK
ncbi:MAG: Holliday junction branch migration protein RuvA [Syntrophomonadaceae bacterium]|mgnify:CR=1 FL=1|nr:Holliday junction branch migration protein RuvA [Syntrophomonadaceae bacterium]